MMCIARHKTQTNVSGRPKPRSFVAFGCFCEGCIYVCRRNLGDNGIVSFHSNRCKHETSTYCRGCCLGATWIKRRNGSCRRRHFYRCTRRRHWRPRVLCSAAARLRGAAAGGVCPRTCRGRAPSPLLRARARLWSPLLPRRLPRISWSSPRLAARPSPSLTDPISLG